SLNRAFRTADIDIIYQFRYIIADLHDQLASLPRPSTDKKLVVYRGQLLNVAELRTLEANVHKGFVAMNTFLSTTPDCTLAGEFAGAGKEIPDGLASVVFEITVGETRQPFADIGQLSAIPKEEEILFSVGTVFRIDDVQDVGSAWLVSLTLTTEVEQKFDTLVIHYMSEIGQKPTLATLAKFLVMRGDFVRAQRYFQYLINENGPELDDVSRVTCFNNLGYIHQEKGELDQAMHFYQAILDIQQRILEPGDHQLSKIYSNIGTVQSTLGQNAEAVKNFELALSIDLLSSPQNQSELATSYNNLAHAYNDQGDYSKAASNYEEALKLELALGLKELKHPSVAITYHNLGSLYDEIGQHAKATQYYEEALTIQKASLPPDHPSRTMTEGCLGMAYLQLGDYKAALEKTLGVLDAKLKMRPPNLPSVAVTYSNLGFIYMESGDYKRAEEHFQKSLSINRRHLPANHPHTAATLVSLGTLYTSMEKRKEALTTYRRALDIFLQQEPPNLAAIAKAYSGMGDAENDADKAIEHLEEGLAIMESMTMVNKSDLITAYVNLGEGYARAERDDDALKCYTAGLELARQLTGDKGDDPIFTTIYANIGSAHGAKGEITKALEFLHKALDISLNQSPHNSLHPELGTIYNNLAGFYDVLEQHEDAINYYNKAIEIFQQPRAPNPVLLAKTYESIASSYDDIGQWEKAIEYYRLALELQLQNLNANDSDLAQIYEVLAVIYEEHENYDTALTYFRPMLAIQQKLLSSSDLDLAEAFEQVASCHYLNSQYQPALELYTKAFGIRRCQKAPLASSYHDLARTFEKLGNLTKALRHYELAIDQLNKETKSEDYSENLSMLYKSMGNIQYRLKQFDPAVLNLEHSLAIQGEFLQDGQHNELLFETYEIMAKVHETLGNQTKADDCRTRQAQIIKVN
ncbi:unnamed protein product, partial [Didymodactylos carnosus]